MPAAKTPPPTPVRRTMRLALRVLLFGLLAAVGALVIAVVLTMASLPSFNDMMQKPNGNTVRVRAADGTPVITLGPSYGDWLPFAKIPKVMQDAIISTEDRRFYSHFGIDPIGVARSVYVARRLKAEGRRLQGASTITQQLARNIFLTSAYNFGRKGREAILALALERKFSKQQILELYLNRVYFGGGSYGVDAASRKFFGHAGDRLTLAEAAIIAGLVKAPSHYSPSADPKAAVDRASVVLEVMQDAGAITPAQAAAAHPEKVVFAPEPKQNSVRYFTDWALAQLDQLVDDQTQPIDVWTTLDLRMQKAADAAITKTTPKGLQGALVSMENDGAVRAMVGGTDYVTSIYNRATQSQRQPGSAFKLFVYLSVLEAGMKPSDPVEDKPVTIDGWSPRNSSRKFLGPMDVRNAFALSINTVAAQLGQRVTFQQVANMAHRFGITTPINTMPSMVLGTSDVRLIELTGAFASVSNNGNAVKPYGIVKVTTPSGEILYQHDAGQPRVLVAPYVAQEMTDLLQTAVNTGTARAAQIGRPVAGKTGTTSSNKDGWFIGFSSGLTTGVWMGRDDSKPVPGMQGGHNPAQAFAAYMSVALQTRPVEHFQTDVTLPEWQLEPDDEAYYGDPDQRFGNMPDAAAAPDGSDQAGAIVEKDDGKSPQRDDKPPQLDQRWLDNVLGREKKPQGQQDPR
jgi:penicillin-binding protein 1A